MTREEKLETLIAYAESFPDLPERFKAEKEKMEPVPECMTPVFLIAEKIRMAALNFILTFPKNPLPYADSLRFFSTG
ncbi:MAG: SufE family protein [Anaerolineales bacterium]|nr:SufE family protein [Anaerolineales bacterium]